MPPASPEEVFIGLGSNLGDRPNNLRKALDRLLHHPNVDLIEVSDFMETAPWGVVDQPAFLNAAAVIHTALPPRQLLTELKATERALGRLPDGPRWGPRIIDLDILLYGDRTVRAPDLIIPHLRLLERDFVLMQLIALRPHLKHPETGRFLHAALAMLQNDSCNR